MNTGKLIVETAMKGISRPEMPDHPTQLIHKEILIRLRYSSGTLPISEHGTRLKYDPLDGSISLALTWIANGYLHSDTSYRRV